MSDNQYMNEMREATNNTIDWLLDEAEEEIKSDIADRLQKAENKLQFLKWKANAEVYRAAAETIDSDCYRVGLAIGKLLIAYSLGFISKDVYTELIDNLYDKIQAENDYKQMYFELLHHTEKSKNK